MSSLIEGYNYDIFISYRQKDNRHDGWVTEFVENLRGELESTFKEEISVYFDINPHDGLLETHDVDESLKEKLKCLIFIPVISRTYCDPKSFAWEHEFKAFVEQASNDQFGLKVKLPNGNVASRVLPVQIHDLDTEDNKAMESVLGSFMRSIEFIYREPGVNRPLTLKDSEEKNLSGTNYRNQINKVALAIRDLTSAIKNHNRVSEQQTKEILKPAQETRKTVKAKFLAGSIAAVILVILGILFIPKLFRHKDEAEKWIAVLPFKYQSDEPDKQYLADGMMDAIVLHLSKIEDLRVKDRTSVEQYRGTTKSVSQIGKELDVAYLLKGSFLKYENNTRLIVQLIDANEEDNVWAKEYNNKWDEIFSVQSEVARTIARELNAAITPEEKLLINKAPPTANLTAYDLTLQAQKIYYDYSSSRVKSDADLGKIRKLCETALELDPGYALAYYWLGKSSLSDQSVSGFGVPFYLDTALYFFNKAIELDSTLSEAYEGRGSYYVHKAEMQKAIDDYNKSIRLSPSNSQAYMGLAFTYFLSRDYVNALKIVNEADELTKSEAFQQSIYVMRYFVYLSVGDFQKAMAPGPGFEVEQLDTLTALAGICYVLQIQGKYEEMVSVAENMITISPGSVTGNSYIAKALLGLGRIQEAEDYIRISLKYSEPQLDNAYWPGIILWMNGKKDEAMKYFKMQIDYCKESIISKDEYGQMGARYHLAGVHAFIGNREEAYKWLREYEKLGFIAGTHEYIKFDPLFDNLRNDDEFKEIVKRANDKAAETRARINELEEQGVL